MRGALVLGLVVLAGCPHSDDPELEPITGRWRALPSTFNTEPPAVADREIVTFGADGTFDAESSGSSTTGTYTTERGRLQVMIDDGSGGTLLRDLDYVRFNDRLAVIAMRPVGATNGVEGTWHTVTITQFPGESPVEESLDLELRAGGTGTLTGTTGGDPPFARSASWQFDGTFVQVDAEDSLFDFAFIGGALGQFSYELVGP